MPFRLKGPAAAIGSGTFVVGVCRLDTQIQYCEAKPLPVKAEWDSGLVSPWAQGPPKGAVDPPTIPGGGTALMVLTSTTNSTRSAGFLICISSSTTFVVRWRQMAKSYVRVVARAHSFHRVGDSGYSYSLLGLLLATHLRGRGRIRRDPVPTCRPFPSQSLAGFGRDPVKIRSYDNSVNQRAPSRGAERPRALRACAGRGFRRWPWPFERGTRVAT
jgi:hypothetical protein